MPKVGNTDQEWEAILSALASSSRPNLGRGRNPPRNSSWFAKLQRVLSCPYKGMKLIGCRPLPNPFRPKDSPKFHRCVCGYHFPSEPVEDEDRLDSHSRASVPTGNDAVTTGPLVPPKHGSSQGLSGGQDTAGVSDMSPAAQKAANYLKSIDDALMAEFGEGLAKSANVGSIDASSASPGDAPSHASGEMAALNSSVARGPTAPINVDLETQARVKQGKHRPPGWLACEADVSRYARTIPELRSKGIGWFDSLEPGGLRLHAFASLEGCCPECQGRSLVCNRATRVKLVYCAPWPYACQAIQLHCKACSAFFASNDLRYLSTLPLHEQLLLPYITLHRSAVGVDMALIRQMRAGATGYAVHRYTDGEVRRHYSLNRANYRASTNGLHRFIGSTIESFPPYPSHFVPSPGLLTRLFIHDYEFNALHMARELKTVRPAPKGCLSLDFQRAVVKKLGCHGEIASQSLTVCNELGMVLISAVTPSTSLANCRLALDEIRSRCEADEKPRYLFMDCNCCNGVLKARDGPPPAPSQTDAGEHIKLDVCHLLFRLTRALPGDHERRQKMVRDLSAAVLSIHPHDAALLREARRRAGKKETGPVMKSEKKFVRRTVPAPPELEARLIKVTLAHWRIDQQQKLRAAEFSKAEGENSTKTDILPGTPLHPSRCLITPEYLEALARQLIHVRNNCVSDSFEEGGIGASVLRGTIDYNRCGFRLPWYSSNRGSSHCESCHSSLMRWYSGLQNLGRRLYQARLAWWIQSYNRTKLKNCGKRVACGTLTSRECEIYRLLHMDAGFEDWSISGMNCNLPVIGWDYHRKVTDELSCIVPLDEIDEGEFTSLATLEEEGKGDDDQDDANLDEMEWDMGLSDSTQESTPATDAVDPDASEVTRLLDGDERMWADVFLPTTVGRGPRKVSRLRSMKHGAVVHAPVCDYNSTMSSVWTRLWLGMNENDKPETLLMKYNEYCEDRRIRNKDSNNPPEALLPVTITQVKDFIRKKTNERSQPVREGCIDETSRKIVADLCDHIDASDDVVWIDKLDAPVSNIDEVVNIPPSMEHSQLRDGLEEGPQVVRKPITGQARVKKAALSVNDDRRRRALAAAEEMGLKPVQRKKGDPQVCGACMQYRAQTNVFPNGMRHHTIRMGDDVMGGGKLWCPFVDPLAELEACIETRRKRSAERYGRYNAKRKKI